MTLAEYRSHPAVNFSTLKAILTSPAHYQAALSEPRKETPAMLIGTLVHSVILEARELPDIAAVKPDGLSLATKDGKAWKAEIAARNLPIISADDAGMIRGMAETVQQNPDAAAMLAVLQSRETPIIANLHGVECKGLLDAHGVSADPTYGVRHCIMDLKTTDDGSEHAFARNVARYHYDMQAAMYSDLLGIHENLENPPWFGWLVVEKSAPYTARVWDASDWIERGRDKLIRALDALQECRESGTWPHPDQGINILTRPAWA